MSPVRPQRYRKPSKSLTLDLARKNQVAAELLRDWLERTWKQQGNDDLVERSRNWLEGKEEA